MQPRRIARELALLGLSQLPATSTKLDQQKLEDLLVAAIRTLTEEAHDTLNTAADEVRRSDRLLHDSEQILPLPLPVSDPPAAKSKAKEPGSAKEQTETQSVLNRIQQAQRQLQRTELALRTAENHRDLRQELMGLTTLLNTAITQATQSLTQLEQRLYSARQIMDSAITLSQEAINRIGVAMSMPEFIQLANRVEVKTYALELLTNLQKHKSDIDQILQNALVGWQLNRLGRIDRDILRLAVLEMQTLGSIPTRVAINEAVELAKKYGNEESATFINGVLRRVSDGSVEPSLPEMDPV